METEKNKPNNEDESKNDVVDKEISEKDNVKDLNHVKDQLITLKKPISIQSQEDHTFKVPKINFSVLRKKTSKLKISTNYSNTTGPPVTTQSKTINSEREDEDKSAAEANKFKSETLTENRNIALLQYKEPSWSTTCNENYKFEVLKNGVINSSLLLTGKSFIVFGRLDICDGVLQHPSISRYHAIVQFRADIPNQDNGGTSSGFYLYDLSSTHGTYLNKMRIKPKVYYRIRVGHMIKFGKSTRMFILQGPDFDQEQESNETVTELIEQRKEQERKLNSLEDDGAKHFENSKNANKTSECETGIDWGMGEDAVEETDLSVNPFALSTPNEEIYFEDPKKTLRGYFEREGCELEYNVEEKGYSHFVCKVKLPIDSPTGQPVIAEADVKGKKKEAVVQCALEACRILDRNGLLRQSQHKSRKRKEKNWEENDFYDSDDDTFLDRTGSVEKKRQKRMEKAKKLPFKSKTYERLKVHLQEVENKIDGIEKRLATSECQGKSEEDSLDTYMNAVIAGAIHDKKAISAMKIQLSQLRLEKSKLEKFVAIARPIGLPSLTKTEDTKVKPQTKQQLPIVGSMHGGRRKFKFLSACKKPAAVEVKSFPVEKSEAKSSERDESSLSENFTLKANLEEQPIKLASQIVSEKIEEQNEKTIPPKEENGVCTSMDQQINNDNSFLPMSVDSADKKESSSVNQFEEIKKREQKRKRKILKVREKMSYCYDEKNPDYAMWMPPEDQAGDGKTHLNDKYGY